MAVDTLARTLAAGMGQNVTDVKIAMQEMEAEFETMKSMVGTPLQAATSSAMTDHNKIYVYTGSQAGYTYGHWYYWNGSAWADGGVYNSIALETDKTLSISDMAADAKATGDGLADLKNAINEISDLKISETGNNISGWVSQKNISGTDGTIVGSGSYSACETFIKMPEYVDSVTFYSESKTAQVAKYTSNSVDGFVERTVVSAGASIVIDTTTIKYIRISVASTDISLANTLSWEWSYPLVEKFINYLALNSSDATQIFASETNPVDYDDFKTPGCFVAGSSTTVSYISNKPNITAAHRLFVISTTNDNRIAQIIMTNAVKPAVEIYKRFWNGTTWTAWSKIIDDESLSSVLVDSFAKNTRPYYTLNQSDYRVGTISGSGDYISTRYYRISTPDIHIAQTDLLIRPKAGYRVILYLFNNGVFSNTISPDIEGAKISSGQEYKISIRIAPEDQTAVVTVADLYDKALFFNPLQQVSTISKHGEPRYNPADFGLIPKAVFYPGVSDSYNAYSTATLTQTVYDAFDEMLSNNNAYITKTDLGLCSDGIQHVYAYDFAPSQIGNAAFIEKIPTVFILCGQHGYEKASVFSLIYLFNHMIQNTDDNPVLNYMRNHVRFITIPVANPWGFNNNEYKNYNGVNLNRNWDSDWEYLADQTSKDYAGLAPFDQPETLAISNLFISNESDITFAVDYHTNGRVAMAQYSQINAILTNNEVTPLQNSFKNAIRYHVKDITSHFKTQFSLTDITDGTFCGYITTNVANGGRAGEWFDKRNKLGCTFETFPGFPGGSTYTADVIKASEELISNFIITVFNYLN